MVHILAMATKSEQCLFHFAISLIDQVIFEDGSWLRKYSSKHNVLFKLTTDIDSFV